MNFQKAQTPFVLSKQGVWLIKYLLRLMEPNPYSCTPTNDICNFYMDDQDILARLDNQHQPHCTYLIQSYWL